MKFATKKTAKRTAKQARRPQATREAAAPARLRRMIAAREAAAVTDGQLQVCIAVASVTSLVTVDASKDPFVVTPNNLFLLTFNDNAVGMSHLQMPIFKANLASLLPQIATRIPLIADNAGLKIGDVADFVTDELEAL